MDPASALRTSRKNAAFRIAPAEANEVRYFPGVVLDSSGAVARGRLVRSRMAIQTVDACVRTTTDRAMADREASRLVFPAWRPKNRYWITIAGVSTAGRAIGGIDKEGSTGSGYESAGRVSSVSIGRSNGSGRGEWSAREEGSPAGAQRRSSARSERMFGIRAAQRPPVRLLTSASPAGSQRGRSSALAISWVVWKMSRATRAALSVSTSST